MSTIASTTTIENDIHHSSTANNNNNNNSNNSSNRYESLKKSMLENKALASLLQSMSESAYNSNSSANSTTSSASTSADIPSPDEADMKLHFEFFTQLKKDANSLLQQQQQQHGSIHDDVTASIPTRNITTKANRAPDLNLPTNFSNNSANNNTETIHKDRVGTLRKHTHDSVSAGSVVSPPHKFVRMQDFPEAGTDIDANYSAFNHEQQPQQQQQQRGSKQSATTREAGSGKIEATEDKKASTKTAENKINVDTTNNKDNVDKGELLLISLLEHVCQQYNPMPTFFSAVCTKLHELGFLSNIDFLNDYTALRKASQELLIDVVTKWPRSFPVDTLNNTINNNNNNSNSMKIETSQPPSPPRSPARSPPSPNSMRRSESESSLLSLYSHHGGYHYHPHHYHHLQFHNNLASSSDGMVAPTSLPLFNFLFHNTSRFRLDFHQISRLGKGGFGEAFKVRHRIDGIEYAVKRVKFSFKDINELSQTYTKVVREVEAIARLDHPNIVRYHQAWFEPCRKGMNSTTTTDNGKPAPARKLIEARRNSANTTTSDSYSNSNSDTVSDMCDEEEEEEEEEDEHEETIATIEGSYFGRRSSVSGWGDDSASSTATISGMTEDSVASSAAGRKTNNNNNTTKGYKFNDFMFHDFSSSSLLGSGLHRSSSIKFETIESQDEYSQDSEWSETSSTAPPKIELAESPETTPSALSKAVVPVVKPTLIHSTVPGPASTVPIAAAASSGVAAAAAVAAPRTASPERIRHIDRMWKEMFNETNKKFEAHLYIQMQLCLEETMEDWLWSPDRVNNKKVDRRENLEKFKQLIEGLDHIHQHQLIHRDVKPANLFLVRASKTSSHAANNKEPPRIIKIGDFGLAKDVRDTAIIREDISTSPPQTHNNGNKHSSPPRHQLTRYGSSHHTVGVGTMTYASPEQISAEANNGVYGPEADIYSAGIILFEMFHPFSTKTERAHVLSNLRNKGEIPQSLMQMYPKEMKMVQLCTAANPKLRPKAAEILSSDLFDVLKVPEPAGATTAATTTTESAHQALVPVSHQQQEMLKEMLDLKQMLVDKESELAAQRNIIQQLQKQLAQLSCSVADNNNNCCCCCSNQDKDSCADGSKATTTATTTTTTTTTTATT